MTLDERIEAIASKLRSPVFPGEMATSLAWELVGYGFPELFTEPPTGWIAPWEADAEMEDATFESRPSIEFRSMRDSFLSRHPTKPTEAT